MSFEESIYAMPSSRASLTLTLLQAREAAMSFFRPLLNLHGLTEQQWRVIRILCQEGEMEINRLADFSCVLKPSMSGILTRLERDGFTRRRKSPEDQRRVLISLTDNGEQLFLSMRDEMESNYLTIQERFGEEKLSQLLDLLNELKRIRQ